MIIFIKEKVFSKEEIVWVRKKDLYNDGMNIDTTKSDHEIFEEVGHIVNTKYDSNPHAYRRLMEIVRDRQAGRSVFP